MKKRLSAIFLSLCLLMTMLPTVAFAAGEDEGTTAATSGTCGAEGSEVNWNFNSDTGTLIISGTGAMMNWKDHSSRTDNEEQYCGNPDAVSSDTSCIKTDCILSRPWQTYINDITKIVVEDGITAIGTDAFNGLVNVTDIVLPDSLTTIGFGAFCQTNIKEMTIPADVSKLGFSAFYGCRSLESLTFAGNKLKEIEVWTFSRCVSLKNFEIPEGVTSIGRGALQECRGLEELVIPESVKSLDESDFGDTSGTGTPNTTLKKVTIKGAVSIPQFMFSRCTALETVDLGNKVTSIGVKAFWQCTALKSVSGLDTVSEIGNYAFLGCENLGNVRFGKNLTTIGDHAFNDTNLTEVSVPAGVANIGGYAFANCKNLTKIVFEHAIAPTIGDNAIANNPVLSVVVLPNMSNFDKLVDDNQYSSFVYWSGQTGQFTVFYVKDAEALAALKAKRTKGADCAFAVAGENAETPSSAKSVLATPSKTGFKFAGWYDNADFTGDAATTAEAKKSYYAKWVGRQLTGVIVAPKEDAKFVYGSALSTSDFVVTEVYDNGETVVVDSADYTISLDKLTSVGPVNVDVTYNGTTYPCTINVDKATPSIQITANTTTLTGGGTVTLTVTTGAPVKVVPTCDGITITENEDGTFSASLPNTTKEYIFTAAYAGDDNHNSAAATCKVSVTRRSSGGSHTSSNTSNTSYTISAPSVDNGKVSVSPSTAKKGDTVTITVTPDTGYKLDKLTVTDAKGNTISVTDKGNGKYTFTMPDSKVTVTPTFVQESTQPEQPDKTRFVDVADNAWYAESVYYVADKGMMTGIGENKFAPTATTTRGMLMTILARYAGQDTSGSSPWYQKGMEWAKAKGISDGTNPTGNITREQLVTMLYRYAGSPAASGSLNGFTDAATVSSYATNAMQWATANGIVNGANNQLNPKGNATRAEMAAILMRFCEKNK